MAVRLAFSLSAFAFNDLPRPLALAKVAGTLHHKPAYLPQGATVRIGFDSDQLGFKCNERLKARFAGQGHAAVDVCARDPGRSGYQGVADQLASAIYTGRVERGVLICSRAIGASAMANKRPGVRAALCHDSYSAPGRSGRREVE